MTPTVEITYFTGYRIGAWTRLSFSVHTLVSSPFRRSILCMLRSIVAGHVMGSPHSARNQPLSPSRSRSPSYQPRKEVRREVNLCVSPAVSFDAQCGKEMKAGQCQRGRERPLVHVTSELQTVWKCLSQRSEHRRGTQWRHIRGKQMKI